MQIARLTVAGLSLLAIQAFAVAEVTELPANEFGGRYLEDSTGLVWLDVSNFYGQTFDEISSQLVGTGFRFARTPEVGRLLNALIEPDSALGSPFVSGSTPPRSSFIGFYNDLQTSSPKVGVAFSRADVDDSDPSFNPNFVNSNEAFDSTGAWVIQQTATNCSNNQDLDFDCDGIDEKVVWRQEDGTWFVRMSATADAMLQQWGLPGDIPIAGDYDGDGVPDLVAWRPSNGTWYVKTSSSQYSAASAIVQQFGLPGDIPMRLDIDADGKLDFVVWRPSEGNFYMKRSSDAQILVEQFGLSGDIPVTAGRVGG